MIHTSEQMLKRRTDTYKYYTNTLVRFSICNFFYGNRILHPYMELVCACVVSTNNKDVLSRNLHELYSRRRTLRDRYQVWERNHQHVARNHQRALDQFKHNYMTMRECCQTGIFHLSTWCVIEN